jgi:hypothetical protein
VAVVIADTSPLQYLFQVGLVDVLRALFETVQVPGAVQDELRTGRKRGFDVPDPADYPWMAIRTTTSAPSLERFELDAGEQAVLSLALEMGASLVLLDDAAAREVANELGVPTTGTLGVLLLAKEQGIITAVAPVLEDLGRRGFRVTSGVRRQILQLAGE